MKDITMVHTRIESDIRDDIEDLAIEYKKLEKKILKNNGGIQSKNATYAKERRSIQGLTHKWIKEGLEKDLKKLASIK